MSDVSDQRRYYERMMDETATEHRQQIDQFERENAALRELVRDMCRCVANIGNYDTFYYTPSEPGCGMDCVINGEGCCLRAFERRARDLGIEVDG